MIDLSKNQRSINTSGAHVDGGDVEALGAHFERGHPDHGLTHCRVNPAEYDDPFASTAWRAYQAGHAAAKAETADAARALRPTRPPRSLTMNRPDAREPYGYVTTHATTGQQFFYRHPQPPYLDNASECIPVYADPAPVALQKQSADATGVEAMKQALEALETLRKSKPLTDDVVRDAERYRWLAGFCSSTSEHWGGRWSIVIEGPAPKSHDSEDDLDDAIDAAMLACIRRRGGDA